LFRGPAAGAAAVTALPDVTRIGEMRAGSGVTLLEGGRTSAAAQAGFDHFAD
jgi:thiamine monophosphate kinase